MPFFTYTVAFAGLAAVPVLIGIYLLRNRFRRQPVSSLMLWLDPREAREGGTRLRRPYAPLLFFLELATIVFFVLAAVDPQVRASQGARPLVVVLDDSFSMQAGGDNSARALGYRALEASLRKHAPYSVRFILAGEQPLTLGEPVRSVNEALAQLDGWRCRAPSSCLEESLALAGELGGELALLLVITDRSPPPKAVHEHGKLAWWAFGKPRDNLAIVNAVRTAGDDGDRLFLEVANFGREAASSTLVLESADPPQEIRRQALTLEAGQLKKLVWALGAKSQLIKAKFEKNDDLALDDSVALLPLGTRKLRVQMDIADDPTRKLIDQAIKSIQGVILAQTKPDLVLTDSKECEATDTAWVVHVQKEKKAVAYSGPFIMDKAHPLTEGLSLRGVVWGAGKDEKLDGTPVIMAGNVPLVLERGNATPGASRELLLRFDPDRSTLQNATDWPIFFWNLISWRRAALPGLAQPNVRLGNSIRLTLAESQETVDWVDPGGKIRKIPARAAQASARTEELGIHTIKAPEGDFAFAVNALNAEESDLRDCESGQWGDWLDETSLRLEYRSTAWLWLLVALGAVAAHLFLVSRAGRA
jgi:hypothetical protein